jgi:DNA-binding transcriptional LysR family regulator
MHSAAARERGITPAMAARHLSELEARLGVTLVQRSTRRLSLTESGRAYLDRAETVLADLAAAEAEVSAQSIVVEGLLRISVPATFGTLHVAPLVARFSDRYPQVTVAGHPQQRQGRLTRPQIAIYRSHVGLLQAKTELQTEEPDVHLKDAPPTQVGPDYPGHRLSLFRTR